MDWLAIGIGVAVLVALSTIVRNGGGGCGT